MPESRQHYLYERLGDHDFQQLVGAVLANQFPDFIPMPLRQADGGRDGLGRDELGRLLVYQVKWTGSGSERNPVAWLDEVVSGEAASLRRLAEAGVPRYVLVTNVPGTGRPETGTVDQMEKRLQAHADGFGMEKMTCAWRETLNAWVDAAPTEIKWAYAEMLAGWDLIRYLVAEHAGAAKDRGLRELVRRVVAAQWADDKRIKFSQSDIDRQGVVDLFVDVTADRVHSPRSVRGMTAGVTPAGGAAKYLLETAMPFTVVRGAPGQGKSTLGQYVCQVHRNAFLPESEREVVLRTLDRPRFPIRADLSDYALWLTGADPWTQDDASLKSKGKPRSGERSTIECFIADIMRHESGGISVTPDAVQDIFERVPSLVVLDGLDEVGSVTARAKVVRAIDKFASRGTTYSTPPKIVVTTRPSAGELAEPDPEVFETLTLNELSPNERASYLRKWCAVRGIEGKDGRALREGFVERSREPYIEELASNPMQLTILLDLIHEQGLATPTQRTDLYDKYVDLLLAREANKYPKVVRKYKDELLDVIPFLGWYLQAHSEESQISSRMSVADLKAAMRHYQRAYGNSESVVDELFEGASDRLWALTGKIDGTYEFEVLSLREYFAARFLYRNAGEGDANFDSGSVARELMRRPYWLNTARFYGGNARGSGVYALAAAIEDELSVGTSAAPFLAAWSLVTDGVFARRPREFRRVMRALCSDVGVSILLAALDRREIVGLRGLPRLPDSDGPDPTWVRLTGLIAADPSGAASHTRVRVLRELLGEQSRFSSWWYERYLTVGPADRRAWLELGARYEAGAGSEAVESEEITGAEAELVLSAGLVPAPGGALEGALLDKILDGQCRRVTSTRSLPAQLAVALSPSSFITDSAMGFTREDDQARRRRVEAISQLTRAGSPYAPIAKMRAFRKGEKGSTFPWTNTAAALERQIGRRWLAYEIAILGAASPFRLSYVKPARTAAFGTGSHPSALAANARTHAGNGDWWIEQFGECVDSLDKACWCLSLWTIAAGSVVAGLLNRLEATLAELPGPVREVVLRAAEDVSLAGWLRERPLGKREVQDVRLAELIRLRSAIDVPLPAPRPPEAQLAVAQMPLLAAARAAKWFKVDELGTYR